MIYANNDLQNNMLYRHLLQRTYLLLPVSLYKPLQLNFETNCDLLNIVSADARMEIPTSRGKY